MCEPSNNWWHTYFQKKNRIKNVIFQFSDCQCLLDRPKMIEKQQNSMKHTLQMFRDRRAFHCCYQLNFMKKKAPTCLDEKTTHLLIPRLHKLLDTNFQELVNLVNQNPQKNLSPTNDLSEIENTCLRI